MQIDDSGHLPVVLALFLSIGINSNYQFDVAGHVREQWCVDGNKSMITHEVANTSVKIIIPISSRLLSVC
jgi:hypothetical protein